VSSIIASLSLSLSFCSQGVKVGDKVTVKFSSSIENNFQQGTGVDSAVEKTFRIGESAVSKGIDEGVVGMKKGGRRVLVFGQQQFGNQSQATIPKTALLIVDLELIGVTRAEKDIRQSVDIVAPQPSAQPTTGVASAVEQAATNAVEQANGTHDNSKSDLIARMAKLGRAAILPTKTSADDTAAGPANVTPAVTAAPAAAAAAAAVQHPQPQPQHQPPFSYNTSASSASSSHVPTPTSTPTPAALPQAAPHVLALSQAIMSSTPEIGAQILQSADPHTQQLVLQYIQLVQHHQREQRERELREQQLREQQLREQQLREQQLREQQQLLMQQQQMQFAHLSSSYGQPQLSTPYSPQPSA
jgi:hypothetical protein